MVTANSYNTSNFLEQLSRSFFNLLNCFVNIKGITGYVPSISYLLNFKRFNIIIWMIIRSQLSRGLSYTLRTKSSPRTITRTRIKWYAYNCYITIFNISQLGKTCKCRWASLPRNNCSTYWLIWFFFIAHNLLIKSSKILE